MNTEEIIRLNREFTIFSWVAQGAVNPIPVARAEGVYLWDVEGRRYLGFSSQLMNVNIGHSHPRVVAAIKEQAERLLYVAPAFATEVRGELGRLLAQIAPGDLGHFQIVKEQSIGSGLRRIRAILKDPQ